MQRTTVVVAAIAVTVAFAVPAHATLNKCAAMKKRCVAKKTQALLKCHASAEKSGANPTTDPVVQACLQKARDKFDGGAFPQQGCFERLEAKGGCLTINDTSTIENKVDAFVLDVVTELDPSYPAPVQNVCSAGKKKCVWKKAAALLKCHYKNEKPPGIDPAKFAECMQKAKTKFDGGAVPSNGCFAKLEARFPGGCLTTDDTAPLEAKVDAYVDDVVCELDAAGGTCPVPTPTPVVTCTPGGATPTPNPNHACCIIIGYACYNVPEVPGAECGMFGGTFVPGGFCSCSGCIVP